MPPRPRLLLLAALLASAAACGSDDGSDRDADPVVGGPDATPTCSVELEVGTGSRDFTPVASGGTVYLFRGPQNGYHLFLSVRAKGIDPTNARLCYTHTLLTPSEKKVGEGCWSIQLPVDLGGGTHERVGILGEIDPVYWNNDGVAQVRGEDVRVDVTLSDPRGCSAQGGWTAHISDDPPPN